jgi:TIR domain/Domain of unknown function (DUF4384)
MHVFISYSSRDRNSAAEIATALEQSGVEVWRDQNQIGGGENYGPKIVEAIKNAHVLLLCCSQNSVSNHNVKQEVQLAWTYRVPCLPVLLDGVKDFANLEYWLTGIQYIDLSNRPQSGWLPDVLAGMRSIGCDPSEERAATNLQRSGKDLIAELRSLARFTDRIWPERYAEAAHERVDTARLTRDLGGVPGTASYTFRPGDRLVLRLHVERRGYLLLLDEGTSNTIYCLSPSRFCPKPHIEPGMISVPGPGSDYPYLEVSGPAGHERLLAILSNTAPDLDLMPPQSSQPARRLDIAECQRLAEWLRGLPGDSWEAFATEFEIVR